MREEERAPAPPSSGRPGEDELLLLLAEQAVALQFASAEHQPLFAPAEAAPDDTPLGSPLATPLTSPVWGDTRKAMVSGGAAGASSSSNSSDNSSSSSSNNNDNSKATRRKAAAQATKGAGQDVFGGIVPICTPPVSQAAGKSAAICAPAGAPSADVKPPIVLAPGKGTGFKRPGMTSSFRGVKKLNLWAAVIFHKGVARHLGYFKDELAAAVAYEKAKITLRPEGPRTFTSQYLGVNWNRHKSRWCAKIRVDGKQKHLGFFVDEHKAAQAYEKAAVEVHALLQSRLPPKPPAPKSPA